MRRNPLRNFFAAPKIPLLPVIPKSSCSGEGSSPITVKMGPRVSDCKLFWLKILLPTSDLNVSIRFSIILCYELVQELRTNTKLFCLILK